MALVDNRTPRLGLLLPYTDNFLQDDVQRLIKSLDDLDALVVVLDKNTNKIADDQLSDIIARLDQSGKLIGTQLPATVVQLGQDGKIPSNFMPSVAIVDTYPVANEAAMLSLNCEAGDIAIRQDVGRTFILSKTPSNVLSNWMELTTTAVSSVNGQVGAVTGLAKSGANADITSLTALSGPLKLGGDAVSPYDAVTLRQLQANAGGSGPTMSGVMNNFIGAVDWFLGSRAKLPAGSLPGDGGLYNRADWPDLWTAINSGMLLSIEDSAWTEGGGDYHGVYTKGNGTTTFRVPDLNGVWTHPTNALKNSRRGLFLRGDGLVASGTVQADAFQGHKMSAPGDLSNPTAQGFPSNVYPVGNSALASTGGNYIGSFRATGLPVTDDVNGTPRTASETRPVSISGIWVIRANGSFTAANTEFNVINSDTTLPSSGTLITSGQLVTPYSANNVLQHRASFGSQNLVGGMSYAFIHAQDFTQSGTMATVFKFSADGKITAPNGFIQNGDTEWTNAVLQNGWQDYPDFANRYRRKAGMVYIEMTIRNGTYLDSTVVATLPVGLRPTGRNGVVIPVAAACNAGNITARITVSLDGTIKIAGLTSAATLSIQTSFSID
ncbi:tail fiber protein [Yersinia phage fHe-Yen8-01]|nr:tail fiber protein [Yersinia phage fHe-Yen8-01]